MLECPYEKYREFDENDLKSNRKTLNKYFIIIESFSMFSRRIENFIDASEESGSLHTDPQITKKVFSFILKVHIFVIDFKRIWENLLPTKHSLILNGVFQLNERW